MLHTGGVGGGNPGASDLGLSNRKDDRPHLQHGERLDRAGCFV